MKRSRESFRDYVSHVTALSYRLLRGEMICQFYKSTWQRNVEHLKPSLKEPNFSQYNTLTVVASHAGRMQGSEKKIKLNVPTG